MISRFGLTGYRVRLGAIVLLLSMLPLAEADQSVFGYPQHRVTDRIDVIYGPLDLPGSANRGFRNNIVLVTTSRGIVVFDPGGSAWTGEMLAARIRDRGARVAAVFNSHAHGDHWLGNEGVRRVFPDVPIYAHPAMVEKVRGPDGRRWLETINRVTEGTAGGQRTVVPDHVVVDGDLVRIGDTEFRIHAGGNAHTDNDIMIEVVGEGALFTGDVVRNGLLGIMEEDASFAGNLAAIDRMLARGFRHYIPGHGPVGGRTMVEHYARYLVTVRETVRRLYEDGLEDFEMKAPVVDAVSAYRGWAGFDLRVGAHVSRAFLEVETEAFR